MALMLDPPQRQEEGIGQEEFKEELAQGLEQFETKLILIAPLLAQVQELQVTVTQTAKMAVAAMELGLTTHGSLPCTATASRLGG